jgi:hypothetical protein
LADSSDSTAFPFSVFEDLSDTPYETGAERRRKPPEAATVWRVLAPKIAGRPFARESRNGGKTYPDRYQRKLGELPAVPAAVPIYSGLGETRTLVIDLDCTDRNGGRSAVLRDADAIRELVRRAGGQLISDESPSGGIHLYLLLERPVPFHEARDMARALTTLTPTMDPQPMLGLTDGLIRPPGAVHKSGGHQQLHGTLAAANKIATERNQSTVWTSLQEQLAAELRAIHQLDAGADDALTSADGTDAKYLPRPGGAREPSVSQLHTARTGQFKVSDYNTPSEARQGVLVAAVEAGMQLTDVIVRIKRGIWPGLASFYTRYKPRQRPVALRKDWERAVQFAARRRANEQRERSVRISPTSEPSSHARPTRTVDLGFEKNRGFDRGTLAEYQFIRQWWAALRMLQEARYRGRIGPQQRMLLRGLAEAAMKSGSRYIEFGTRALDLATGMDHTTVAAHLRSLREEDDPMVVLVESERGLLADLYELRIPDEVAGRAARESWRGGKIHALRPAFRELGLPAAFVYEELERAREPLTSFDLATSTGMSRSTIYEALETLAAYDLAQSRNGRWLIVHTTNLAILAETLGCTDIVRTRWEQYRRERNQFRQVFHLPKLETILPCVAVFELVDDTESAMDLLERVLGARRIA